MVIIKNLANFIFLLFIADVSMVVSPVPTSTTDKRPTLSAALETH